MSNWCLSWETESNFLPIVIPSGRFQIHCLFSCHILIKLEDVRTLIKYRMILFHQPTQPRMIYWGETMNVPDTIMWFEKQFFRGSEAVGVHMYLHWKSSYQEGRFGITLTGLNPKHVCVCPKQGHGFSVQCIKVMGNCLFCWFMDELLTITV